MRVLVTGASGHVGGAVATALAAAGHEVVGLGRRPLAGLPWAGYVRLDLASAAACDEIRSRVDACEAVIHAAAAMGPALDDREVVGSNCLGTQQIVLLARAWNARRLVYISGVPVIGTPRRLPVTEDHPTSPPTAYHATKLFGESLVRLAGREGFRTTTLRLTAPVGPGTPPGRVLPVFVRRALAGEPLRIFGRGTREQNYVDVRDVADAVQACLEQEVAGLYNVAGSASLSNVELARRCLEVLGSRSEIEWTGEPDPQDDLRWQVSIEKARRRFGYVPRRSIERSIQAVATDCGEELPALVRSS